MVLNKKIWMWLCLFLAIALQVQITLPGNESYTGLRLSLADASLPILGLAVLSSLLLKKSFWPQWQSKWTIPAVCILSTTVAMGIIGGYFYTGEWSKWALFNKGIGWGILISYFLLGAWITTNCSGHAVKILMQGFVYFFCILCLALIITMFTEHILTSPPLTPMEYPIDGLMDNRNVYSLLMLCVFGFIICGHRSVQELFPAWLLPSFSFLIPFFVLYNGSRVSWIAIAIIILSALFILGKNAVLKILLPFSAGLIICFGLLSMDLRDNNIFKGPITNLSDSYQYIADTEDSELGNDTQAYPKKMSYVGDSNRLIILKHSLDLWKTSPIIGVGIGTSQKEQLKDFGQILSVIDSTPLWVLTEMGLLGLLVFSGFFIFCFVTVWKSAKQSDGIYGVLSLGMILCLMTFGTMCLLHEFTYTRFIWFLLGLSMAVPANMRQERQEP